jgi:type VI secretion system FHA domain protein
MTLTLELTAGSNAKPGDVSQRAFGEDGGTIGRAPNNTWVLSHNKVSGRHANITYRGGVFYIEDVSRNGVCVNSPDNRLVHNRPYALKSGDRIFIEPYEIGVWVEGGAGARPDRQPVVDPFADLDPFAGPGNPLSDPILPETPGNDVVDPLLLIPGGTPAPKRSAAPPPPSDNFLGQHYQPPAVVSPPAPPAPPPARESGPAIPAGYNPLAPDDSVSGRIAPPRPRPAAPPVAPPGYDPLAADDPFAAPAAAPPPPVAPPVRPVAAPPIAPPAPRAPAPVPPALPPEPVVEQPPAAPEPVASTPVAPVPTPPSARQVPLDALGERPASVPPVRPRPGVDSSPRRRTRDATSADSQTLRLQEKQAAAPEAVQPPPAAAVPAEAPPASVPPASRRSAAADPDLAELLAGAGVPNGALTPELTRSLGQILRVVVAGLMDVLQSRQKIKEEFGMQQTLFRPADNNPLKFSVNVEDALHNLLVKRNPAYLGTVDAFADAFDDLRDHQLAVLAGMRVAFESMLAEFDPDRLQEEFDKHMGGGLALMPAKMRYWDQFRARRADMAKDAEETFEQLFGEQFRRAYEEQFRKLKAERRHRKEAPGPTPAPEKPPL